MTTTHLRFRQLFALLLACLLLPAASDSFAAPKRARPVAPAYAEHVEARAFAQEMQDKYGFDADTLLRTFSDIRPIPSVIKAVMPPKDPQVRSWTNYRARFIEPSRIEYGLRFWQDHQALLNIASRDSGVPAEYIVAIIGIESIYGRHMGSYNTFAALSTLAFDYPKINPATDAKRKALFRGELEALLLLARESNRDPLSYHGSYAGALGLPQFLPSSVRSFARDGDADQRIDLDISPADAIASVANFLKQHGWESGGLVSLPAQVSGERYSELIAEGILPKRSIAELANNGVTTAEATPALSNTAAALIDLVTPEQATEYRLGLQNFYVITRYNRSSFYAMAVHDLAQTLRAEWNRAAQVSVE